MKKNIHLFLFSSGVFIRLYEKVNMHIWGHSVPLMSDLIPDASIFQERWVIFIDSISLLSFPLSLSFFLLAREMGAHSCVVLCLETQCPESKSNLRERETERETEREI